MKWIAMAFAALCFASAGAQQLYTAGKDYQLIEPAQPTDKAGEVEVVEVFGYLCPHCANFQPYLEPWVSELPEGVEFRRVPVVFQRSWEPLARAYYTAEALGILDQAHPAVFDALHTQRKALRSNDDLAEFFGQFGVPEEDYMSTAKSFTVETRLRRGVNLARRWGVTGTPSVVINGKYLANGSMAGSYERLIEIVDHLVAMELAAMTARDTMEAAAEDGGEASQ